MTAEATKRMVGQAIKRREDPQLITGHGNFLDDVKLAGMAHAAVLRSPYAHARITAIDISKAKAMPGVIDVIVGSDMLDVNPLPCAWPAGGFKNNLNTPRAIADGVVRFVGEAVAVVIAENRYVARDAIDALMSINNPFLWSETQERATLRVPLSSTKTAPITWS